MTKQERQLLARVKRDDFLNLSHLTAEEKRAVSTLASMGYLENVYDSSNNPTEVFRKKPKCKSKERGEKRRYYRYLVLTSVTSLGIGLVFAALFKALGLPGILLGALMLLAGYLLAVLS